MGTVLTILWAASSCYIYFEVKFENCFQNVNFWGLKVNTGVWEGSSKESKVTPEYNKEDTEKLASDYALGHPAKAVMSLSGAGVFSTGATASMQCSQITYSLWGMQLPYLEVRLIHIQPRPQCYPSYNNP